MKNKASIRGSLVVEEAEIISHVAHAGHQWVLRLQSPKVASRSMPGHFVHIQCDANLPMRRPMSLMRADAAAGWVEILYKAHGNGTRLLAKQHPGQRLSLIGPIGVPFEQNKYRRRPLLMGGGVGIPPMIFLAEHLKKRAEGVRPLVIMGSEVPFPFRPRPSRTLLDGMPTGVIAAMPLLDDWGIPSRLTSAQGYAGCYDGYVTDLADHWLNALDQEQRSEVEIFACGPTPMLKAVATLAADYGLPCQISLEEYMACAVGGCAGCTVAIQTEAGLAMKRVCVDGPVFDAATVVFKAGCVDR